MNERWKILTLLIREGMPMEAIVRYLDYVDATGEEEATK